MRVTAVASIVAGPAVGGLLLAGAWIGGVSVPFGLALVAGLFASAGLALGVGLWMFDRRRRRLLASGLRACIGCRQPMSIGVVRCPECGRRQGGLDPLQVAITRARVGADENHPCPECGRTVRLDRASTQIAEAPGQHRCRRCGAIRHE